MYIYKLSFFKASSLKFSSHAKSPLGDLGVKKR
jgi:hypothetical protein